MDGAGWQIPILIILVAMSAFFSGTETAFTSFNKTRMKTLAQDGNKRAKAVLDIEDKYEKFLSTMLVGNNIVNIALFGIDTRDTKSFKGNSDSIMILSLNANTKKVKIISIMRDTLVPMEYEGKNYYAKYALADAKYTYSVPYRTTVSTALDALAHAIESMFSPRADFLTEQFALISIKMIYPILEKLSKSKDLPTEEDRDTLYFASLYAGFALNKGGTGFPHGMGYALTEDYDVPHGIACAVFIPQYLDEAEKANPELFGQVMNAMNSDKESVKNLISQLCDLNLSIPDEKIQGYVTRWETLKNFKNSPTDFNNQDAGKLVKSLFCAE